MPLLVLVLGPFLASVGEGHHDKAKENEKMAKRMFFKMPWSREVVHKGKRPHSEEAT